MCICVEQPCEYVETTHCGAPRADGERERYREREGETGYGFHSWIETEFDKSFLFVDVFFGSIKFRHSKYIIRNVVGGVSTDDRYFLWIVKDMNLHMNDQVAKSRGSV